MSAAVPAVSVILPSYNYASYLPGAVDSVLRQTRSDWELIIYDDGSTDGSFEAALGFSRAHPDRVRCHAHEGGRHLGLIQTYRRAVELARGRYAAFLEADDAWNPAHLERLSAVLDGRPEVSVAYARARMHGDEVLVRNKEAQLAWRDRFETFVPKGPFHACRYLVDFNFVLTFSSFMTRRAHLEGIDYGLRHPAWLDWWVLAQLGTRGRFHFLPDLDMRWRIHAGNYNLRYCRDIDESRETLEFRKAILALYERTAGRTGRRDLAEAVWHGRSRMLRDTLSHHARSALRATVSTGVYERLKAARNGFLLQDSFGIQPVRTVLAGRIRASARIRKAPDQIPVIVSVDAEPDEWLLRPGLHEPWYGYETCRYFFEELRPALRMATRRPVHYTWFYRMDLQIELTYGTPQWGVRRYRGHIDDVTAKGDETALHTHAYRWDVPRGAWVADHADQTWVDRCVTDSFAAYREFFGAGPASFRFGSRWMNNPTMSLVERLGARYELTVEPGYAQDVTDHEGGYFEGVIQGYVGAPQMPYRPAESDFRRADPARRSGIWVIPLSTGMARHPYSRRRRLRLRETAPESLRPFNLRLDPALDPVFFRKVTDHLLKKLPRPYLSLIMRTDIFSKPQLLGNVKRNFKMLLAHPLAGRFRVSTPAETLAVLGYPAA